MFAQENFIIFVLVILFFIVTWPYNISARLRAKKEAEARKASAKNNQTSNTNKEKA